MPTNSPYFSPAWMKQQQRLMQKYSGGNSQRAPDMNDPQQAAMGLYNAGMRIGQDGMAQPTQDFGGMMAKASQGINSLSRGIRGGSMSTLGKPLNSMYEQNPGFFRRGMEEFGAALDQRQQQPMMGGDRESRIAQAKQAGTFEGIRSQFNERAKSFGQMMDEAGNISTMAPYRPGLESPTAQSQMANRAQLEEGVAGRKLMDEAAGGPVVTIPTVTRPMPGSGEMQTIPMMGAKNISGKYGTGFATATTDKNAPRSEGMINGKPFSEIMQGLANKPGIAREGDKFQPQNLTPAENERLKKAAQRTRR